MSRTRLSPLIKPFFTHPTKPNPALLKFSIYITHVSPKTLYYTLGVPENSKLSEKWGYGPYFTLYPYREFAPLHYVRGHAFAAVCNKPPQGQVWETHALLKDKEMDQFLEKLLIENDNPKELVIKKELLQSENRDLLENLKDPNVFLAELLKAGGMELLLSAEPMKKSLSLNEKEAEELSFPRTFSFL